MRVLCTGPESSGTRLLARLIDHLDVEAVHRSVPHANLWWDVPSDVDRIIVIVRDPFITEISAKEAGHPTMPYWSEPDSEFPYRLTHAWEVIIDQVRKHGVPWIPITYEGLIARPQWTLDNLSRWLGVEPVGLREIVVDPRQEIR